MKVSCAAITMLALAALALSPSNGLAQNTLPDSAFGERQLWKPSDPAVTYAYGTVVPSPDGTTFAIPVSANTKWFVQVGDKKIGGDYDSVDSLTFSPDGKTVIFVAKRAGKEFVCNGEAKGEDFDWVKRYGPRAVFFGGTTMWYQAGNGPPDGGKMYLVMGEKKEEFERITWDEKWISENKPVFQARKPNNKFFLCHGDKKLLEMDREIPFGQDWIITNDGKFLYKMKTQPKIELMMVGKKHEYDEMGALMVSPDGNHFAFNATKEKKAFMVIDGVKGKDYENVQSPKWSPDSKRVDFNGYVGGKNYLVFGTESIEANAGNDFSLALDGKTIGYTIQVKDGVAVVIGKKKSKPIKGTVSKITFSPDSKSVAYIVRTADQKDPKEYVVLNDKKMEESERITTPISFSDDSKSIIYGMQKGKDKEKKIFLVFGSETIAVETDIIVKEYVVRGQLVRIHIAKSNGIPVYIVNGVKDASGHDSLEPVAVSPNGKALICAAKRGSKQVLTINGNRGEEFDEIKDLVFAPDGETVAYKAQSNGKWFVIVGEKKSEELQGVLGSLWFSSDGMKIAFAGIIAKEIWWKNIATK